MAEVQETKKKDIVCPFCGGDDFTGFDNCDSQATALYCDHCPAGMEDSRKTLTELIALWHSGDGAKVAHLLTR